MSLATWRQYRLQAAIAAALLAAIGRAWSPSRSVMRLVMMCWMPWSCEWRRRA